ncbi:thiamine diphosphokinase [bacterium]|nr:MAG: thiamine diphosphokinase [bacterium]
MARVAPPLRATLGSISSRITAKLCFRYPHRVESKKVLGVLAGRDLAPGALEAWLSWADLVVAADGGADLCRAAGREPDKIVGDLDSISNPAGLTPDKDQDSSDADKLLAYLIREGHQAVTLIGVEGDRLDHVLGTLYSCARADVECLLVLRTGTGHVHRGPKVIHGMGMNRRMSLMPLGRCRVTAKGFRWSLDDAWLDPLGLVSLSNVAVDPTYELRVHEGALAVITNATIDPCST